jgi:hypothetical protein
MARRDSIGIRFLTRNGYDWSPRYPLIVQAVDVCEPFLPDRRRGGRLRRARLAMFDRLRYRRRALLAAHDFVGGFRAAGVVGDSGPIGVGGQCD